MDPSYSFSKVLGMRYSSTTARTHSLNRCRWQPQKLQVVTGEKYDHWPSERVRGDDVRGAEETLEYITPRLNERELPSLDETIFEMRLSNVLGEAQRDVLHKYLEARKRAGGLFAFYCSIVFPGRRFNHPATVARPSQDVFVTVRDALVKAGALIPDGNQYVMGEVAYRFI